VRGEDASLSAAGPLAAESHGPGPSREPAGIYLHWPFCARKCPYCDFFTFGREHPTFNRSGDYLRALLDDIGSAPDRFELSAPPPADTIYFGGGTPSLLTGGELRAILSAVAGVFDLLPEAEVTLEVNPTAAGRGLAESLEAGVNRLSIGCQSLREENLALLGRDHDAPAARATVAAARRLGCRNVSVDVMFGLPGERLASFVQDLEELLALGPDHLSAYALTFHEGTPFKRWRDEGRLPPVDEDAAAAMFEWLMDRAAGAGFEHYEVSNWCRPGRRSRHNSKYWRRCDVFAFGASAHGIVGGARYENPRDLDRYLGGELPSGPAEARASSPGRSDQAEIMMLASRRVEGVPWEELSAWLGGDPQVLFRSEIRGLVRDGLLEPGCERFRLTRRGLLFADAVARRFF